jgi:hypothetical protein
MRSRNGINEVGIVPRVLEKLAWIDDLAIADRHGLYQELGTNAVVLFFGISKRLVPEKGGGTDEGNVLYKTYYSNKTATTMTTKSAAIIIIPPFLFHFSFTSCFSLHPNISLIQSPHVGLDVKFTKDWSQFASISNGRGGY